MPDRLPVETFTTSASFEAELSEKVAVAVLSLAVPESRLSKLVPRIIATSPSARICLSASSGAELDASDVPHDETIVRPVDRESFTDLITRLYVRAYYVVTMERYFKIAVSIRHCEFRHRSADAPDDETIERLDRLKRVRDRTERYLSYFRDYLDQDDIRAIKSRPDRLDDLVRSSKRGPDPSDVGLPETCPGCGLDWTAWHGPGLRDGYQRLGADTWECTKCGHVVADTDAQGYYVN
ncbi:hypothetical protein [Halobellus sp. EA9]|uniref:hypothetical protein n=1 Tax=Halobellus sp. EA9 TaxID=3421647 RepID=UPI003EC02034